MKTLVKKPPKNNELFNEIENLYKKMIISELESVYSKFNINVILDKLIRKIVNNHINRDLKNDFYTMYSFRTLYQNKKIYNYIYHSC